MSCFGHNLRKRYSENSISNCVLKYQLGLENGFGTVLSLERRIVIFIQLCSSDNFMSYRFLWME